MSHLVKHLSLVQVGSGHDPREMGASRSLDSQVSEAPVQLLASILTLLLVSLPFASRLPKYACQFVEMCLMVTADHGPAVSGAHNTIICARAGKDLVSSLTSGLLTIVSTGIPGGENFRGHVALAMWAWLPRGPRRGLGM